MHEVEIKVGEQVVTVRISGPREEPINEVRGL